MQGGATWARLHPRNGVACSSLGERPVETRWRACPQPVAAPEPHPPRRRLSTVLKAAMIVALLGTGWFAYHVVEFHMPASIAEAMPRL